MAAECSTWMESEWLVIDTETTGVDPLTARVVELAAVKFRNGEPTARHGMLLDPGMPIPKEATAIHGITDADVRGQPSLAEVAARFLAHVRAADVLVAYNWPFDAAFLESGCPGWDAAIVGKVVLDPLVVVRFDAVGRFWPGAGRHQLESVYRRIVDDEVPGHAHRASTDAVMAGRILWALRANLPADGREASAIIERERHRQRADYEAWKAKNGGKR